MFVYVQAGKFIVDVEGQGRKVMLPRPAGVEASVLHLESRWSHAVGPLYGELHGRVCHARD